MDKDLEQDLVGEKVTVHSPGLGLEKGTGHLYSTMQLPTATRIKPNSVCMCKHAWGGVLRF